MVLTHFTGRSLCGAFRCKQPQDALMYIRPLQTPEAPAVSARYDVAQQHLPTGGGCRRQIGSRYDAVGNHRCSQPERVSTPSMTMTLPPAPDTLPPQALRKSARSVISGSRAALDSMVVPRAHTAASITFSVAPTLGNDKDRLRSRQVAGHVAFQTPVIFPDVQPPFSAGPPNVGQWAGAPARTHRERTA